MHQARNIGDQRAQSVRAQQAQHGDEKKLVIGAPVAGALAPPTAKDDFAMIERVGEVGPAFRNRTRAEPFLVDQQHEGRDGVNAEPVLRIDETRFSEGLRGALRLTTRKGAALDMPPVKSAVENGAMLG
jgi:hypothetical protein